MPQVRLTTDWAQIDGGLPIVAGKVLSGTCQIEYAAALPAATDNGIPFSTNEPFSASMATGDKLYARAIGGDGAKALIGVWRRAAT